MSADILSRQRISSYMGGARDASKPRGLKVISAALTVNINVLTFSGSKASINALILFLIFFVIKSTESRFNDAIDAATSE